MFTVTHSLRHHTGYDLRLKGTGQRALYAFDLFNVELALAHYFRHAHAQRPHPECPLCQPDPLPRPSATARRTR